MSFQVLVSERASKDLAELPRTIQARIVDKLREARHDPVRFFRPLTGSPLVRMRVGDYRVLAEIDHQAEEIRVQVVGHRKNVYEQG